MTSHDASLDHDLLARLIDSVESADDAMAKASRSTMLTPRFYTTDFDAMDRLDVSPVRAEWDAMMAEYEGDNNHDHFQRDAAFEQEAREGLASLSPELRQEFLDFLISSCTSAGTSAPNTLPTPTTCSAAQVFSSACSVNLLPGTWQTGHSAGGSSPS